MSWSLRRTAQAFLAVAVLAAATLPREAAAQRAMKVAAPTAAPVPADKAKGQDADDRFDGISLPKDNKHRDALKAAADYIASEDWPTATRTLDQLLSLEQDVYAEIPRKNPDGKTVPVWTSVRAEAERLIATLPPAGMAFYRLNYNPKAAELLRQAKASGRPELLARVIKSYLHTDAGAEATELLATYRLDRGEFADAARCFDRLIGREGVEKLPPPALFKAAYAYHHTGAAEDKPREERVWKELDRRGREVQVGKEARAVADLRDYVDHLERATAQRLRSDWPVYGGNEARNAMVQGTPPFMEERWLRPCVDAKLTEGTTADNSDLKNTERWLKRAQELYRDKSQPVLPSLFPVTATVTHVDRKTGKAERVPLVLYRDWWGVHAYHVKTGEVWWRAPSGWSLAGMETDPQKFQAIHGWLNTYLDNVNFQRPDLLLENSVTGTLSNDGAFAYLVEDLAVPPPLFNQMNNFGMAAPAGAGQWGPAVAEAAQRNVLQAYSLDTGRLEWEIPEKAPEGGAGEQPRPAGPKDALLESLKDCYFLGPPLPLGGKLYVLTERQQELRLACINPTAEKKTLPGGGREIWVPKVESVQTLATTKEKIQNDVSRRTQAAHLAYGEGILVCPTNAGAVLGLDLLSGSLLWAYPYRERGESHEQPGNGRMFPGGVMIAPGMPGMPGMPGTGHLGDGWKVTAPVIADGKVVFTAPDARSIHCVNLRDGTPVWSHPRGAGDLFLGGVVSGRVLVVGKGEVRALGLAKGETLWRVQDTGVPSGQGAASGDVYYLPLREAARDKQPEVCAIDVVKGAVVAHTKSRPRLDGGSPKPRVPGNLVFYEGEAISQSADEVAVYPQLKVKLDETDRLIAQNPDDPKGLTSRGELRLDEGNLQGALDDLTRALDNKPDAATRARARAKLYDTLTSLFQNDFAKAEPHLARYEELCNVEAAPDAPEAEKTRAADEARRRRANFLCLVAKGRQAQGRLVEAFDKYQEFSASAAGGDLVSVADEPTVKAAPDVWSRGRIEAMLAHATPAQRKPLEERLAKRWEEVRKAGDVAAMKKFVAVFGSGLAVGKEAVLELADRLGEDPDPKSLLEAERLLNGLRGPGEPPEVAARAVDALARLYLRKAQGGERHPGEERLLEDAAYLYRLLGRDYAGVAVRDGKTGADLYNVALTDKRMNYYMDDPARPAPGRRILYKVDTGSFQPPWGQAYHFAHAGEELPFFRNTRLSARFNGLPQLKLTDRATDKELWGHTLNDHPFLQNIVYGNGQPGGKPLGFQTLGHLVVLPLGHLVLGIDPLAPQGKQVLWQVNLAGTQGQQPQPQPGGNHPMQPMQIMVDPRDGSLVVVYTGGWSQRLGDVTPLDSNSVCLQTRDALVAVDPVSGRTLWTRSDVTPRSHVFGDGQNVYVVDVGEGGPSATRAFRAFDGVTVRLPADFAALYAKRLRQDGRTLLVADAEAGAPVTVRLYDVLTGKDVWKQTFKPGAHVLHAEDPGLAGAVEPDGTVRVYDVRSGKEVVRDRLYEKYAKADLDKVQSVHLLADADHYYVACNLPADAGAQQFGGVQSNLQPGTGLRCLPVNGGVYAFGRADGKRKWRAEAANQTLVLDHFADMPILLFSSRFQRWQKGAVGRAIEQVATVQSVDKRTGKLVVSPNETAAQPNNFHTLNVDPQRGRVELVGYQARIVHYLDGDTPGKPADAGGTGSQGVQPGTYRPGRIRGGVRFAPAPAPAARP
jgi:outer membrane protein assembly factor BamB